MDPRLAAAITAMFADPARPWTLPDLADLCGMSRATFMRQFQDKLGRSALDLLTDLRMSMASLGEVFFSCKGRSRPSTLTEWAGLSAAPPLRPKGHQKCFGQPAPRLLRASESLQVPFRIATGSKLERATPTMTSKAWACLRTSIFARRDAPRPILPRIWWHLGAALLFRLRSWQSNQQERSDASGKTY